MEKKKNIKKVAKNLGFNLKKSLKDSIDKLYCQWLKKDKRKELLHWGFGKL
jgi:hypothetical protein